MASDICSKSVTMSPKDRERTNVFRGGATSSSSWHTSPRSSNAVRWATTLNLFRKSSVDMRAKSKAERMPRPRSLAPQREPTPQTSPTSTESSARARSGSVSGSWNTPWVVGSFLAMRLASLASVLVGAIPIEMGMPVHCLTRSRMVRHSDSTSKCCSGRRSRNTSSME